MIRINLLPVRETKKQARLRVQAVMLAAAAAAGVGLCVVWHLYVTAQVATKRRQIQAAQVEMKKLEETKKEVDRYRQEEEDISRKLAVIDSLERTRFANVRVMDEISTRIPERMWLTEMTLEGGRLSLKGISIDAEIVAQFLQSLEKAPDFHDVELEGTELAEVSGLKLNSFRILARYGTPPAAAAAAAAKAGKAPGPAGKK